MEKSIKNIVLSLAVTFFLLPSALFAAASMPLNASNLNNYSKMAMPPFCRSYLGVRYCPTPPPTLQCTKICRLNIWTRDENGCKKLFSCKQVCFRIYY